jgi:cytidylate kinase
MSRSAATKPTRFAFPFTPLPVFDSQALSRGLVLVMAASHPVIALDGTAASGKSTFARALAQRLGFAYVNTGAMYRGVTWYLQENRVPLQDGAAVVEAFAQAPVEARLDNGDLVFLIAGFDPLPHVREGRVNDGVSLVAQVPEVRRRLVAQQQSLAQAAPLVMEGRDIGTVVFPGTPFKFFLDADPEVRAQRRQRQGENDVIHQRDSLDQQRRHSPLACAPDALRLDSGHASVAELVEKALAHLSAKGLPVAR